MNTQATQGQQKLFTISAKLWPIYKKNFSTIYQQFVLQRQTSKTYQAFKVTVEVGHLLLLFTDTNPLCVVLVLVLQKTMPPKEKVEWWTLRHSTFNTNKYLIDIVIQLSRDRLDNLDHEYITLRHHVAFTAFPTYKAFFAKRFFQNFKLYCKVSLPTYARRPFLRSVTFRTSTFLQGQSAYVCPTACHSMTVCP